ncbi:short-chain collagen C4-like isoform X2 [Saccostrea cucullata]|uniref:short-chain collagen C4-like isoform X2 n=1 Tax=Saccostrea cuccullata TaxID=36930 RepID=UPI002ED1C42A
MTSSVNRFIAGDKTCMKIFRGWIAKTIPLGIALLCGDYQNKIQSLESLVSTQQTNIQSLQSQVNKSPDQESMTTYTVWGRKNCPQINGTTTVYSGISAGAQYNHGGGGSNTLCLTHNPDHAPSNFPTSKEGYAQLFGSEYQFTYKNYALDDDVPCAVCLVDHSSVILMIASKTTCPSGWNVQYRGFLTSQSTTDGRSPSEYLCLHDNAEYLTEGARQHNLNGRLFYPVMAICGSLPCPPYTNSQYITCVVCSK